MTSFTLGQHYLKSALFLAHASYAAYEDNPETYEAFQKFHFDNLIPFSSDPKKDGEATRGFLAERKDAIVLAFRGTDGVNLQDWAINLNIKQVLDNGAYVHEGFALALASVWDKISVQLQKMVAQNKRKIWITGHSLGGALATLATRRLLNMNIGQIETYTFGQPRVGDKTMCQQITSTFYRFAYASDPVVFVPFKVPKTMSYTHVGMLKQIDAIGCIHEDASNFISRIVAASYSVKKIINEFLANDPKTFVFKRIKDHLMPNYVEKIAQVIKNG